MPPQDADEASALATLYGLATECVRDINNVLIEVRNISRDPMPANMRGAINDLKAALEHDSADQEYLANTRKPELDRYNGRLDL
jgi:hypothetical protein